MNFHIKFTPEDLIRMEAVAASYRASVEQVINTLISGGVYGLERVLNFDLNLPSKDLSIQVTKV